MDATGAVAGGAAFFAGAFGCCVGTAVPGGWAGIGLDPLWPGGRSGCEGACANAQPWAGQSRIPTDTDLNRRSTV